MSGAELGRYDHGVDGRTAQACSRSRMTRASRSTSPARNSTAKIPPPGITRRRERRVFGLGIRAGRLYYAVAAGLQIWSIGINPDGTFGNDPAVEINVPPAAGATEISKITFDDQGRMLLAERPAPTGAYDFEALTQESVGAGIALCADGHRCGRLARLATRARRICDRISARLAQRQWRHRRRLRLQHNDGLIDSARCGGFLWSTGEQLRKAMDPALIARLRASGPLNVDGLQGNYIWRRPSRKRAAAETHISSTTTTASTTPRRAAIWATSRSGARAARRCPVVAAGCCRTACSAGTILACRCRSAIRSRRISVARPIRRSPASTAARRALRRRGANASRGVPMAPRIKRASSSAGSASIRPPSILTISANCVALAAQSRSPAKAKWPARCIRRCSTKRSVPLATPSRMSPASAICACRPSSN